jgi:hypothetical protein
MLQYGCSKNTRGHSMFVAMMKYYNFDECDSYSASVIAANKTKAGVVKAVEDYAKASMASIPVEWNEDQDAGKIGVVADVEIVEIELGE